MILTPDAPHGLFSRSVVLAEHERLDIEVLESERSGLRSSSTAS